MKTSLAIIFSALSALAFSGCMGDLLAPREDPSKFYILSEPAPAAAQSYSGDIAISSVILPGYLNRTQITLLNADGTVGISEFNRWVELPEGMFSRVFARALSKNMPKASVFLYPELPPVPGNSCDVRISISRCIGSLGGDLHFEGRCLYTIGGKTRAYSFAKRVSAGKTYGSYVDALSRCVAEAASEISKEISKNK